MPETQSISTIVQGGAVGIALAALYVIYRMQNGQRLEFMDELKASRDAHAEQAQLNRASMEKMADGANATAKALGQLTHRITALSADRRTKKRKS